MILGDLLAACTMAGIRPSRVFKLSTASTSTEPLKTRKIDGCVGVDNVDRFEMQPDDPESSECETVTI